MKPTTPTYYFWESFFSKEQIEELHKVCATHHNKNYVDGCAYDENKKYPLKKVFKVQQMFWGHAVEQLSFIDDQIILNNRQNYGFNIDKNLNSDAVLFTRYKELDNYDWHTDTTTDARFDQKFTVLINSSLSSYEGGELQLFGIGGEIDVSEFNQCGSVVMFKSYMPHRVKTVTKGTRDSIVYWKNGPSFV